jgi:hypothetical protein
MGGRLIVAVSHQRVAAQTGSIIPLGFAPHDLHLFDATTGLALLHGTRLAAQHLSLT